MSAEFCVCFDALCQESGSPVCAPPPVMSSCCGGGVSYQMPQRQLLAGAVGLVTISVVDCTTRRPVRGLATKEGRLVLGAPVTHAIGSDGCVTCTLPTADDLVDDGSGKCYMVRLQARTPGGAKPTRHTWFVPILFESDYQLDPDGCIAVILNGLDEGGPTITPAPVYVPVPTPTPTPTPTTNNQDIRRTQSIMSDATLVGQEPARGSLAPVFFCPNVGGQLRRVMVTGRVTTAMNGTAVIGIEINGADSGVRVPIPQTAAGQNFQVSHTVPGNVALSAASTGAWWMTADGTGQVGELQDIECEFEFSCADD